jgi:hypothetical protein
MVRYTPLFLLLFFLSFLLLAPKRELYFQLEKEMAKSGIYISGESVKETTLGVELEHPRILYEGAQILSAKRIKIVTVLLYTRVVAEGMEAQKGIGMLIPVKAGNLLATYRIWEPGKIALELFGKFGRAVGYYDMKKSLLHLDIVEESDISTIKSLLKKGKNGWYYEERFR